MIKASELRIGNRLSPLRVPTENIPFLGYSICAAHIAYTEEELNHDWEPILLTPEILEKCGFESKDVDYEDIGYIGNDGESRYQTFHKTVFKCGQMSITREVDSRKFEFRELSTWPCREVLHFHQLQNLYFALTGEELNVQI